MTDSLAIHLHQTHLALGDLKGSSEYLINLLDKGGPGLHLLPELFVTGYPLQDLCLHRAFIEKVLSTHRQLHHAGLNADPVGAENQLILFGGLDYTLEEEIPVKIENVIYSLRPGQGLQKLYSKRLLPNYDIFDEAKYFSPGNAIKIIKFANYHLALTICEDMWASQTHLQNPIAELYQWQKEQSLSIDLVVNLSASPYNLGKSQARVQRAQEIVQLLGAPFAYVNRVGIEDEILFDGQSFICDGLSPKRLARFKSQMASFDWPKRLSHSSEIKGQPTTSQTPWQSLFEPRLEKNQQGRLELTPWSEDDCAEVLEALKFGIQDFAKKCGFKHFLVANSGGIDSALVLAIAQLSCSPDQKVESLFLPSQFSSIESYSLSEKLAKNLGTSHRVVPIKFFHSVFRNQLGNDFRVPLEGLADENIQARLRAVVVYARSNQTGAMVLNTSNKSELAVGYSTIYGDSVGALSVIGDLYKTEVYQMARYINKTYGNPIPIEIIERAPSAELRSGQTDQQSLPPYPELDAMLEGLLSYRFNASDLINQGHCPENVTKIMRLYHFSQFKRKQFAPIIKVKNKSFGFGHRVPICKDVQVYI